MPEKKGSGQIELELSKRLASETGAMDLAVSLQVAPGELLAISGPSGSGKTTLLRLIAGLLRPDKGRIQVGGSCWQDSERRIWLPPQQRHVGMVFQDYSLFPNMTVRENLTFALEHRQSPAVVDELIEITELEELADRRPHSLSGGQQQRVAVARALVRRPRLLLLDEPLSALDAAMRSRLQDYILLLHHRFGLTTLLVTHDHSEIFKMANRVIQIEQGRIVRDGAPQEVFFSGAIGGRFQLSGMVLAVSREDVICIVKVMIGRQVVEVIAAPDEVEGLQPGDRVGVLAKAFNPVLVR